jgi:Predicted phosphohydrolase
MSIFSMADLHLSLSTNKPMDVFGSRWRGYTEKIEKNWRAVVSDDDTVIVPGDISWALSLEETRADMLFIESLPGKKLLGKGNHDYWWTTMNKMKTTLSSWNISSIDFLYNNAHIVEDYVVCGTRGWYIDEKLQNTPTETDYTKIVARETIRLDLSLKEAKEKQKKAESADGTHREILVFLHFPPIFKNFVCTEFIEKLKEHNIRHCYFGHIHGLYTIPRTFTHEGINFTLISADYLNFIPMITLPIDY